MKKDNKKALYESIMTAVAKEVKKALNENLMDIEYGGKDNNIFQNMKFNWQYIDKLQKDETELIQFAFGKLVNNMTVVKIIPTDEFYNAYSKIHNKSTNDVDAEKEFNNVNSMILLGFNNTTNESRSTFYVSELDGDWGKVKNAAEDCQKFLKRCVFEVNTQINKKQEHILCNFNFKIFKNDIGKYASILRQAETIVKNSPYILYSQIIGDLSENDFGRCICNIFVNNGKLFGLQTDNKTKIEFNVNKDKAGLFSRL